MKYLFGLIFLLIFLLPSVVYADKATNEPLTLLNQPTKNIAPQQQQQTVHQPQELRDIYGPIELQDKSKILVYIAVIALLLLLIAAVFFLLKKRKQTVIPAIPPWEKALSELSEARELLTPDRALLYMNRISLILRNYVESRFTIKSTRQTTREFLHSLNNSSADPAIRSCKAELQTCLEQCDMAKFAHQIPLQENMQMMEGAIIGFVEKTRP
jgi:hypothetical protein